MKAHKKLIFTILISMVFVTFIACDGEQQADVKKTATDTEKPSYQKKTTSTKYASIAGKYIHPTKPEKHLLLNANGSFFLTNDSRHSNGGKPYAGTFTMKDDEIRLQLTAKTSTIVEFKDGAVVDRKGARWEKQ